MENEFFLESILDNMNDPVFLHNSDGELLYVNDTLASITGYSKRELGILNVQDLFEENYGINYRDNMIIINMKNKLITQSKLVTKSGGKINVEINAVTFPFHGETCILCSTISISNVINQNYSNEMKDELKNHVTSILHRLIDPIIIINQAALHIKENPTDPNCLIDMIVKNAESTVNIVEELKELTKSL